MGPGPDDVVVDARGTRCPVPVLRAARRARDLPGGAVLAVLATDPATAVDLPAWARLKGHDVVAVERPGEGELRVRVRLREGAPTLRRGGSAAS